MTAVPIESAADERRAKVSALRQGFQRLRGSESELPDVSIVIPVNAQADTSNVFRISSDIVQYQGNLRIETVLAVNNYPPGQPPDDVDLLRELGVTVLSDPSLVREGELVPFSARMHGLRQASSEVAILFDADCRIPNIAALLEWYARMLGSGADVAYTHVAYYDAPRHVVISLWMAAHHAARWFKRFILQVPTTRGSNFAVRKSAVLDLYDRGYLQADISVGPVVKALGGSVVYTGNRELVVLTSGRYLKPDWRWLVRYLWYRVKFNVSTLRSSSNGLEPAGRATPRERNSGEQ